MGSGWKLTGRMLGLSVAALLIGGVTLMCFAGDRAPGAAGGTAAAAHAAPRASALALEDAIVAAADGMLESVVSIEVRVPMHEMGMFGWPFGGPEMDPFHFFGPSPHGQGGEEDEDAPPPMSLSGGSGTVYSADGHIVTNNHMVQEAQEIRVTLHDGRTFEAVVVGTDPASDLAVIKIDAEDLQPVRFADMEQVKPGQFAIAVGMPLMLDYSVTVGHVSALGRGNIHPSNGPSLGSPDQSFLTMQNFIQTDASINPGNSGGPLVTLSGEVMGINGIVQGGIGGGFGFAIPADLVQLVAAQLIDSGNVSRAWLGLEMSDLTYEVAQALEIDRSRGALVEKVHEKTPAKKAKLQRGDVITAVDGFEVANAGDVVYRVGSHMAGDSVQLTYLRDGKEKTIKVKTGDREEGLALAIAVAEDERDDDLSSSESAFGMELDAVDREINEQLDRDAKAGGVLVRAVVSDSAADRAGIRPGDVIIDVDGKDVSSPGQVFQAIEKARRSYVPLSVERDGRQRYVALKKEE